jgi:hypothetical protein
MVNTHRTASSKSPAARSRLARLSIFIRSLASCCRNRSTNAGKWQESRRHIGDTKRVTGGFNGKSREINAEMQFEVPKMHVRDFETHSNPLWGVPWPLFAHLQ